MTLDDYFGQQERRKFPLPKHLKSYTHIKLLYGGGIEIAQKDNGTGRLTLFGKDKARKMYWQGITWQDLEKEAQTLRAIVRQTQLDGGINLVVD